MKNKNIMKKSLVLISTILLTTSLFGCNDKKAETLETETNEVSQQENEVKIFTDKSSGYPVEMDEGQSDLNENLKTQAIKGEFIKINAGEMNEEKVFLEGEVSVVDYDKVMDLFPSFMLTTKEGDGFGVYHITNILNYEDIKDDDTVKVYGTVDSDKNDSGIPKITGLVVEKL